MPLSPYLFLLFSPFHRSVKSVAWHRNEDEFKEVTEYLVSGNVMAGEECRTKEKDENTLELSTWLAIDDNDQEGVWTDSYTGETVPFLPWAEFRPNDDTVYNCVELEMTIANGSNSEAVIKDALLYDIECDVFHRCPICMVSQPVIKLFVRGLCENSQHVQYR